MGKVGTSMFKSLFPTEGPQGSEAHPSTSSLALRAGGYLPCLGDAHTIIHRRPRASPWEGGRKSPPEVGFLLGALPFRVLERLLPPDLGQGLSDLHQPGTQEPLLPGACPGHPPGGQEKPGAIWADFRGYESSQGAPAASLLPLSQASAHVNPDLLSWTMGVYCLPEQDNSLGKQNPVVDVPVGPAPVTALPKPPSLPLSLVPQV